MTPPLLNPQFLSQSLYSWGLYSVSRMCILLHQKCTERVKRVSSSPLELVLLRFARALRARTVGRTWYNPWS